MKTYSFHHKETGLFLARIFSCDDDSQLKNNTPADHVAIEGRHDSRNRRVNTATGEVMDYQPPQPSVDHEWNAETRIWQLNVMAQEKRNASAAARIRIAQLEASQHRAVREAALNLEGAIERLKAIDAEIAELRKQLLT
jgi:hypothetical protein